MTDDTSDESESENEGNDSRDTTTEVSSVPKIVKDFLGFLQLGTNGNPIGNYPAVVLMISTVPQSASRHNSSIDRECSLSELALPYRCEQY